MVGNPGRSQTNHLILRVKFWEELSRNGIAFSGDIRPQTLLALREFFGGDENIYHREPTYEGVKYDHFFSFPKSAAVLQKFNGVMGVQIFDLLADDGFALKAATSGHFSDHGATFFFRREGTGSTMYNSRNEKKPRSESGRLSSGAMSVADRSSVELSQEPRRKKPLDERFEGQQRVYRELDKMVYNRSELEQQEAVASRRQQQDALHYPSAEPYHHDNRVPRNLTQERRGSNSKRKLRHLGDFWDQPRGEVEGEPGPPRDFLPRPGNPNSSREPSPQPGVRRNRLESDFSEEDFTSYGTGRIPTQLNAFHPAQNFVGARRNSRSRRDSEKHRLDELVEMYHHETHQAPPSQASTTSSKRSSQQPPSPNRNRARPKTISKRPLRKEKRHGPQRAVGQRRPSLPKSQNGSITENLGDHRRKREPRKESAVSSSSYDTKIAPKHHKSTNDYMRSPRSYPSTTPSQTKTVDSLIGYVKKSSQRINADE